MAAVRSAAELRIPLLTSSLTTAAAFLPIYLAESTTGEYTAPIFEVVTITLLSSWLLALTMTPLFYVKFLKVTSAEQSFDTGFYRWYRGALNTCIRFRWVSLAIVVAVFFLAAFYHLWGIRLLLGMIRPTAGEACVLGCRITRGQKKPWASVGYLVETAGAYPELTVRENIEVMRRLHPGTPPQAVGEMINHLGLSPYTARRSGTLSLGNTQRLGLAKALLHKPRLLLLDEPANGLDPAGIVEIRQLLIRLAREEGITIFISSHILGEVARLADRIGIRKIGCLGASQARCQADFTARHDPVGKSVAGGVVPQRFVRHPGQHRLQGLQVRPFNGEAQAHLSQVGQVGQLHMGGQGLFPISKSFGNGTLSQPVGYQGSVQQYRAGKGGDDPGAHLLLK